ncbi:MAG: hypothetical protein ACRYG8_03480 [Janthinobacterium lividum]
MSGMISHILGGISAVEGLVSGAAVTLGGVGLTGMEVPARIPFGGDQRLVVHKMPGGGRVVDALGRDDRDIEWSGTFTGSNAVSRALQLDALRVAGRKVVLTWGNFRRTVVVKTFDCDYGSAGSLLPYRVVCVVVTVGASTSQPTLLSSVAFDISSALDLPALLPAAQTVVSTAQSALPVAAVLTKGSPAFLALSSAVGSASSATSAASTLADTQLAGVAAAGTASGATFGGLSNLTLASAAADAQAAAVQATGFIGRAVKNLAA